MLWREECLTIFGRSYDSEYKQPAIQIPYDTPTGTANCDLPEAYNTVFVWDSAPGNSGTYRPTKSDTKESWGLDTNYDIKMDSKTVRTVTEPTKYWPNDNTDYLFRWTSKDESYEIKEFELLDFGGNKFKNINSVNFYDFEEKYSSSVIRGHMSKPILTDNDSAWNWSFVNEHLKDDGSVEAYAFITISVSTDWHNHIYDSSTGEETIQQETDITAFDVIEDNTTPTGYRIEYKKQTNTENDSSRMGYVHVDCSCKLISADDFRDGSSEEIITCSDAAKLCDTPEEVKEAKLYSCNVCHNYVKEIYKALNTMQELNMTMYVPYINSVTDHWYRNVYFTPASIDQYNKDTHGVTTLEEEENIILNDDEYEGQTGERWTLYETYKDGSKVKYKLYVLDDDKNYTNMTLKEKDGGDYKLSDDGVTYEKVKDGEKGQFSVEGGTPANKFLVAKKPKNENALENTLNSGWSAYSENPVKVETGWQMLSTDQDDLEDMDPKISEVIEKYDDLTLVSNQTYEGVEQVEEGIRGETNSKIKKIFLDDYYIYDGSVSKASLIQNFKRHFHSDDPEEADDNTELVASFTDGTEANDDGTTAIVKGKKKDVSGKINLTKDSLNAFAILKNMKSLDSEYIYHDFKELIVELNYFDKEDLLEGGQKVMMFPVQGLDSTSWPLAEYDRDASFYGTLIHSSESYEALEKGTAGSSTANTTTSEPELTKEEKQRQKEEKEKYERKGLGSGYQKGTFAATAQACWDHVVKKNPDLDEENKGKIPGSVNGLMNDRMFVSWVLYEYGYDVISDTTYEGSRNTQLYYGFLYGNTDNYKKELEKFGWECKFNTSEDLTEYVKKGDIITTIEMTTGGSKGHTVIVSDIVTEKDKNGEDKIVVKGYDCIRATNWNTNNANGVDITYMVKSATKTVIRVDRDKYEGEFEGYEGGENVVAPVSGQIIDYGTVERKNEDTGGTEQVGYIKIKVLDNIGDTRFVTTHHEPTAQNGDSASLFLSSKYNEDELDKLGFDYFQEEYFGAGISGHILYMEGFEPIAAGGGGGGSTTSGGSGSGSTTSGGSGGGSSGNSGSSTNTTNTTSTNTPTGAGSILTNSSTTTSTSTSTATANEQKANKNNKNKSIGTTGRKSTGSSSAASEDDVGTAGDPSKRGKVNPDADISGLVDYIKEDTTPNRYTTQYVVPNIADNDKEFKAKVHEEAKKKAAYAFEDQGSYYIKEGAVIGKTKEGGAGNYLRIILRDLDDEVVEHVDEYIETGDNGFKGLITEEFICWMGFTSEGAIVAKKGDTIGYESADIGDGVGNSGPFGLTYYCAGVAADVGYDKFDQHQKEGFVPLDEGDDVFVAVLESERQYVLSKLRDGTDYTKRISDYTFLALVDLSHAGPVMLQESVDKLKSQGYLTQQDWTDNWGTAAAFKTGLIGRAARRGFLALDEKYTAGNGQGNPKFSEVVFTSPNPWKKYTEHHCSSSKSAGGVFGIDEFYLVPYDGDPGNMN